VQERPRVDFSVYPIGLTKDVDLSGDSKTVGSWLASLQLAGREAVLQWSKETGDRGDYHPAQHQRAAHGESSPPGAYVIEARGEGKRARDIIPRDGYGPRPQDFGAQSSGFRRESGDGEPIGGASVLLWERYHDGTNWRWARKVQETDKDGIATFALEGVKNSSELFASAVAGDRQCFATAGAYGLSRREGPMDVDLCLHGSAGLPPRRARGVESDRSADGRASLLDARRRVDRGTRSPEPRGTKAASGTLALGEFGSAAATVQLDAKRSAWRVPRPRSSTRAARTAIGMRLCSSDSRSTSLPEFKVAVRVPE
jgi:hypothetical protein